MGNVVGKPRRDRKKPRRNAVDRYVWGVQDGRKRKDRKKGNASAKKYSERGEILRALRMETYLHGPMDLTKKLKLLFRVRDLDLPKRRKRYTSSRDEGEILETHRCAVVAKQ